MADETKPKEATAADKAKLEAIAKAKKAQDALAERVKELKKYEGKTFRLKNPSEKFKNQVVTIEKYSGIMVIDPSGKGDARNATPAHVFLCESKNPNMRWTPVASRFLAEYEEIETPEAAQEKGVI